MSQTYDHHVETVIMQAAILLLIGAGYRLTVWDGGEDTITRSADPAAIFDAMRTTDEDCLVAHKDTLPVGWVRFIYGNEGSAVICDYTTNLEGALKPLNDLGDALEGVSGPVRTTDAGLPG